MTQIILPFQLPTLNDIINTARSNKYASAAQKKKYGRKIKHEILIQLDPIPHYDSIDLEIIWVESPKKRDPDNIFVGAKFLLDSFVDVGIIDDDTRDQIKSITNKIEIEKSRKVIVNFC